MHKHARAYDAWFAALAQNRDCLRNESLHTEVLAGCAWWSDLAMTTTGIDAALSDSIADAVAADLPAPQRRSLKQRLSRFGV